MLLRRFDLALARLDARLYRLLVWAWKPQYPPGYRPPLIVCFEMDFTPMRDALEYVAAQLNIALAEFQRTWIQDQLHRLIEGEADRDEEPVGIFGTHDGGAP